MSERMKKFTIETHYIGAAVGKPQAMYHLVNNTNGIHEHISKSLEAMFDFCRFSELGIKQEQICLVISDKDKERWNRLSRGYNDFLAIYNNI